MEVRGRLGTRYEDFLTRHVQTDDAPADELVGHSGYFTKPGASLDPRLFAAGSDRLRPGVRNTVLEKLYGFWKGRYNIPRSWSRVWIAGSGISYQWNAERGGVGDLDVLIGVNMGKFRAANPEYQGLPEPMVATHFNKELHDELWPTTAEYQFADGQDPFEITFYVNPGAADIRDINPYAAYDVTGDSWTVRPPALPDDWDPFSYFPKEMWEHADRRMDEGRSLVHQYTTQAHALAGEEAGTGAWRNAAAQLSHTTQQAVDFFEEIHQGRRAAFLSGGKGYYGPENVLWQYGKMTGVIDALRAVKATHDRAHREASQALYGDATLGTDEAMLRASLWNTKNRMP